MNKKVISLLSVVILLCIPLKQKAQVTNSDILLDMEQVDDIFKYTIDDHSSLILVKTPSVIFFRPERMNINDSLQFYKRVSEVNTIAPVNTMTFPNFTVYNVFVQYENDKGKFVVDNYTHPAFGMILSDGIETPVIVTGVLVDYNSEFKNFFSVHSSEQMKQYLLKRTTSALERSSMEFNWNFNKITKNIISKNQGVVPVQYIKKINGIIYDNLHTTEIGVYKFPLKNKDSIRSITCEVPNRGTTQKTFNREGQLISYSVSYFNDVFHDMYIYNYNPDGSLSTIEKSSHRNDLNTESKQIFRFIWVDNFKLHVYLMDAKKLGPYVADNLDKMFLYVYMFNNKYNLLSSEWREYNGITDSITDKIYSIEDFEYNEADLLSEVYRVIYVDNNKNNQVVDAYMYDEQGELLGHINEYKYFIDENENNLYSKECFRGDKVYTYNRSGKPTGYVVHFSYSDNNDVTGYKIIHDGITSDTGEFKYIYW